MDRKPPKNPNDPQNESTGLRMPMPWFRMWSEFADDPKVQIMPEAMQRRLVMLLLSPKLQER